MGATLAPETESALLFKLFPVTLALACAGAAASPFASQVVDYDAGSNAAGGYTNAAAALGSPERFTGEGVFPSGVTPFNPAFGADEIVSVGSGGSLTLRFDTAITNNAGHLYGVDMIVFGNAGFIDQSWTDADPSNDGSGALGANPAMFGAGGAAEVWVSADGSDWRLAAVTTLALFPTLGFRDYLDPTPGAPGSDPTDFTRPMDPTITLADLAGMGYTDLLALYGESGGGVGIDISGTGLASASFVQFRNTGSAAFEIDAVAAVPAPAGVVSLALGAGLLARRRRA